MSQNNLFLLGTLILGVIAILLIGAINLKKEYPTWGERIKKLTLESTIDMRNMYILSATYGMCEIGELFGNLKHVKEILSPEEFQKVVKFHTAFSNAIGDMYNLVFYREKLRVTDYDAVDLFEQYRTDALYAYNRLIEIKNEHNIAWNDPLMAMSSMYPVV